MLQAAGDDAFNSQPWQARRNGGNEGGKPMHSRPPPMLERLWLVAVAVSVCLFCHCCYGCHSDQARLLPSSRRETEGDKGGVSASVSALALTLDPLGSI